MQDEKVWSVWSLAGLDRQQITSIPNLEQLRWSDRCAIIFGAVENFSLFERNHIVPTIGFLCYLPISISMGEYVDYITTFREISFFGGEIFDVQSSQTKCMI